MAALSLQPTSPKTAAPPSQPFMQPLAQTPQQYMQGSQMNTPQQWSATRAGLDGVPPGSGSAKPPYVGTATAALGQIGSGFRPPVSLHQQALYKQINLQQLQSPAPAPSHHGHAHDGGEDCGDPSHNHHGHSHDDPDHGHPHDDHHGHSHSYSDHGHSHGLDSPFDPYAGYGRTVITTPGLVAAGRSGLSPATTYSPYTASPASYMPPPASSQ
jgi:hypothetical protein